MPRIRQHLVTLAVMTALGAWAGAGPGAAAAQTADDLFRPDVLHEVRLQVHSRDWALLQARYLENTYYPCELTWNGLRIPDVAIRSRGNATRSGVKPGLRADFNRYTPGRRVFGQASLVLDNLLQDPSMLREALATRVYARLGFPVARQSFARLYVNDRYHGLYAIVEAIEEPFLDRVYGESDGYLFEYHWLDYWYFTYPGPALQPYIEMFEPRTHTDESPETLAGPIEDLVRVVNEIEDDRFEAEMGGLLPLDEVLAQVAVDRLLTNIDWLVGGWGVNNLYLYRSTRTGRWRFIPWDLDVSMQWTDLPVTADLEANVLTRRSFTIPWLRDHYFTTLAAAADSLAEPVQASAESDAPLTWLEAQVEQAFALVRDAALEDGLKPYSNEEFEASVAFLRHFAKERPRFVRCEAARVLDPATAALHCP